jgi:hypothetical protein
MNRRPDDDAALLAAAKAASTTPRPTAAQTARRARALERAIAQHALRQRRALPRRTVAAAALLVAGAASATTALLVGAFDDGAAAADDARAAGQVVFGDAPRGRGPSPALATPAGAPGLWPLAPLATDAPAPTSATPQTAGPAAPTADGRPTTKRPVSAAAGAATGPAASARANEAATSTGADAAAGAAGAEATTTSDGTAVRGSRPRGRALLDAGGALDAGSDDDRAARALRDRCAGGLRARRDRAAIDDCRVFGQRFPGHPAARALAFGAGGLAEELGLPRDAIDAYSRAILLSPLVGAAWDDALLARARVHAEVGDLEQARADLRIYLHRSPAAVGHDDVQRLRRALRLER